MSRTRKNELEFANFVCKFGDHNLMDLAEEVVIPAFFSGDVRKYGKARWVILDAELVDLEDDELGLIFRLVKDTRLEREQVLVGGVLRPDHQSLRSSPSALGLLVLNSHRLMYYPETQYAPSLSELRATAEALVRQEQKRFVANLVSEKATSEDKKALRVLLWKKYPPCVIRILPLSDADAIATVMERYKQVNRVSIRFAASNHELEWDSFFKQVDESRTRLGAKSTKLEHSNRGGLDHAAAVSEVIAATASGNSAVVVTGRDKDGDTLRHENDGFSVRVPIDIDSQAPKAAAPQMKEAFLGLIERGILKAPAAISIAAHVAKRMLDKFGKQ